MSTRTQLTTNYTKYNNYLINKKVIKDLDIIVKTILQYREKLGLVSIILGGGFGRGEGSVIVEKNGEIKPLNDYDIFLIVDNNIVKYYINYMFVNKILIKELISKIDIPHIDILLVRYSEIRNLPPRILYYELKYGSRVIYGKDVLKEMPEYKPTDIPPWEGLVLLFNRIASLIYGCPLASNDAKFIIEQCVKGILGSCEALLVLCKEYHHSYEIRNKIFKKVYSKNFPELYRDIPYLTEYYDKATRFKLYPDYSLFNRENLKDLWIDVSNIILKVLKYYIYSIYDIEGENNLKKAIQTFIREERRSIRDTLVQWLVYSGQMFVNTRGLFRYNLRHPPMIYIYACEPFLLNALINSLCTLDYIDALKTAKYYLKKVIRVKEDWDPLETRKRFLIAWSRGLLKGDKYL